MTCSNAAEERVSPETAASAPDRAVASRSLASDAKYVLAGRIAGMGGAALVAFLIPRCLSPEDCGKFLIAQNIIGLGALVAAAGLPLAVIRILGEGLARGDQRWIRAALLQSLRLLAMTSSVVTLCIAIWLLVGGGAWLKLETSFGWLTAFAATLLFLAWQ